MSNQWSIEKPFLVADSDIPDTYRGLGYPLDVWDELVAAKVEATYRHGAFEAAELMLSEPGVVVSFVNATSRGSRIWDDSDERYKRPECLLGFNDHGGGSESHHKILLNRFGGRSRSGQYVLWSPPAEDYRPSSTTFYKADFTFLTHEPITVRGKFEKTVPNPLKTLEPAATMQRPNSNYNFYLVGNRADRSSLVRAFRAAGFTFLPRPLDYNTEYTEMIAMKRPRSLEDRIEERTRSKKWPNGVMGSEPPVGQFAAQIARLRIAEASL